LSVRLRNVVTGFVSNDPHLTAIAHMELTKAKSRWIVVSLTTAR
jgi:hypothetical protein